jgi:multiple antibiotic resistance protein
MFAVIAPIGAITTVLGDDSPKGDRSLEGRGVAVGASAIAFITLSVFALLSEPLLDWLNVSGESFQFAAAASMFPLAIRLILIGDSMALPQRLPRYAWLVPFAIPMLAGPSSIITAISYAARFGEAKLILASGLVLVITGVMLALADRFEKVPFIVMQAAGRLSGGLLLLIAVELAIDGVRSV